MAKKLSLKCADKCGENGVYKFKNWWTYTGSDIAISGWLVLSLPILTALLTTAIMGYFDSAGPVLKAVLWTVGAIAFIGAIIDAAIIGSICSKLLKESWEKVKPVLVKINDNRFTQLAKKLAFLLFVMASPVYIVWYGASWHSAELSPHLDKPMAIGIIFAIGFVYDANRLFTNDLVHLTHILARLVKRTLIRILGLALILADKC